MRIDSILKEPTFLKKLINSDFLPKLISSFSDYDNIYVIITYYEGQSLDYFRDKILTEEQIKFVSACVIQSLIHLREQKIIHRDIMMKNIIMDNDRYFNLIDFSFSINYSDRKSKKKNMLTYNKVTPPEILNRLEYDYNSDYYRLGSVIYYLIFKKYPFNVKIENNITDIFINYETVKNYSYSCIDFLNKLLLSDYKKRLGFGNISELTNHYWLKDFNWTLLRNREMVSPFQFIKNANNESFCNKFTNLIQYVIRYRIQQNKYLYKILIKNFDFVNKLITRKIFLNFNKK